MKIIFKVLAGLLVLLVLAGLAVVILFNIRQKTISSKITGVVRQYAGGEVEIGKAGISFFAAFPYPAVDIHDLTVKDSLNLQQNQPFFKADHVFVSIDPLSILTGKSSVRGLKIVDGEFNVFTAENGTANDYLFKGRPAAKQQGGELIKNLTVKNVMFNSVNEQKNKRFSIEFQKLKVKIKQEEPVYKLIAKCDVFIEKALFQNRESAILSKKRLTADFKMLYDPKKQFLNCDSMEVELNGRPLNIGFSVDMSGPTPVLTSKINSGKFLLF